VCVQVCMHIHSVYIDVCICVCVCVCICVAYTRMDIYTHICAHINAYIYVHESAYGGVKVYS